MFVESILAAAATRLASVSDDTPLIDAAKPLRNLNVDVVVACNRDGRLAGIVAGIRGRPNAKTGGAIITICASQATAADGPNTTKAAERAAARPNRQHRPQPKCSD